MHKSPYFIISVVISLALFFTACKKEDPESIWKRDRERLLNYISENELDAQEHESGLFYVVDEEGTGAKPNLDSRVQIKYVGYFLDEKVFDLNNGAVFNLRGTIPGWQIGIPLFKVGSKGMLLIPSALGYGQYPPYGSGVPRNSCLIFDIEIIDLI